MFILISVYLIGIAASEILVPTAGIIGIPDGTPIKENAPLKTSNLRSTEGSLPIYPSYNIAEATTSLSDDETNLETPQGPRPIKPGRLQKSRTAYLPMDYSLDTMENYPNTYVTEEALETVRPKWVPYAQGGHHKNTGLEVDYDIDGSANSPEMYSTSDVTGTVRPKWELHAQNGHKKKGYKRPRYGDLMVDNPEAIEIIPFPYSASDISETGMPQWELHAQGGHKKKGSKRPRYGDLMVDNLEEVGSIPDSYRTSDMPESVSPKLEVILQFENKKKGHIKKGHTKKGPKRSRYGDLINPEAVEIIPHPYTTSDISETVIPKWELPLQGGHNKKGAKRPRFGDLMGENSLEGIENIPYPYTTSEISETIAPKLLLDRPYNRPIHKLYTPKGPKSAAGAIYEETDGIEEDKPGILPTSYTETINDEMYGLRRRHTSRPHRPHKPYKPYKPYKPHKPYTPHRPYW